MKRIFPKIITSVLCSAILLSALLPLLSSCTGGEEGGRTLPESTLTEEGNASPTEETEEIKVRPQIDFVIPEDKNLAIQLEQIPIAREGMSEAELRSIVLKFFKLQLTFAYTPDFGEEMDSYSYYISALNKLYGYDGCKITFEEGKAYGGVPYMQATCGTAYRWLAFYDRETGFMDWEPIINSRRLNWSNSGGTTYPDAGSYIFGNSCSSSCFWAFARVSNELNSCWTAGWSPNNGFVKVGDFELNESGTIGDSSKTLTAMNGKQKMYNAYALIKGGDGLVHTGHAVMAIEDAHVVYQSNGLIDGENSYIIYAEQQAHFRTASPLDGGVELYSPLNGDGATFRIQGFYPGTVMNGQVKEMKWTFNTLYEKGYFPFTIPEYSGAAPIEPATATIGHDSDKIRLSGLRMKTLSSNYYVSDVHFSVKDANGKEVFTAVYCSDGKTSAHSMKNVPLNPALFANPIYDSKGYINFNLSKYTDGNHTLEIQCRVSTGEMLSAYVGTLTE
ncbi:MAG: hypothetical protein IKD31_05645 [Clostridia bacterium]|nr:hypothetical protein [Clostridia bacterium]